MLLKQLSNEYLEVQINDDASGMIRDRASGMEWRMGRVALQDDGPLDHGALWPPRERSSPEQFAGRFIGRVEGDHLRFTLLGRQRKPIGSFTCQWTFDGPWLQMRLLEIDAALPGLVYPPPIECESMVLPAGVGRWIRHPLPGRSFHTMFGQLNQRWFGMLRGDRGCLAVLAEGHTEAGVMLAEMSASPGWTPTLGQWRGPKLLRYRFTQGGYVGLAKAYRAWAMEQGLHKPLAEKIAATPALDQLVGGRLLGFMQAFTLRVDRTEDRMRPVTDHIRQLDGKVDVFVSHADVQRIIADARSAGFQRGMVIVRGWSTGGYDEMHPDVWPPEPALGSEEELRRICAASGLPVALHDNYADMYDQAPSFPKGIIRRRDGRWLTGGLWAGGQCYILNARDGLANARRNWGQIRTLGPQAMFIDTTTAVRLYEDYDPQHTLTRLDDERFRHEMLRFYKEQGLLLGSEEVADFGADVVDWFENRHTRIAGESVPLWPLVFHDAAFCARYATRRQDLEKGGAPAAPSWLADMLWGYMMLIQFRSPASWESGKAEFASTFHVDAWHKRVGAAEMLSHRYLTDDGQVEQTVFAPGHAITANFASEPRTVDGRTIPAGGYVISD